MSPAVPAPRRRPSLKEEVAEYLRTQILSGELRPGEKIDQEETARALDVSKLPVREALISLESQALVETRPRRGAYVAPLTREDVHDHYSMYGQVSSLAAERAARRLTDEQLDELEQIVDRMAAADDAETLDNLNFAFHRIINQAGASRRLVTVLRLLAFNIPHRFFEFTTDWPERAERQHREILAALRARDPDAAAEAMGSHLSSGAEQAVSVLESSGFWDDAEQPDGG